LFVRHRFEIRRRNTDDSMRSPLDRCELSQENLQTALRATRRHIVSLLVTGGTESIGSSPETLPTDGGLQVASFSAGRHLAFVVSDLSAEDTSRLADAMAEPVAQRPERVGNKSSPPIDMSIGLARVPPNRPSMLLLHSSTRLKLLTIRGYARHFENKWAAAMFFGLCAFFADGAIHASHYPGEYSEAALTGIGAFVLSLAVARTPLGKRVGAFAERVFHPPGGSGARTNLRCSSGARTHSTALHRPEGAL